MTEKTKRIVLIAVCCALCAAVGVGIITRFGGSSGSPSGTVSDDPASSNNPTVDIDPAANGDSGQQISVDIQGQNSDSSQADPAQGADSSGTEQTIQADPVKPEAPDKPESPAGTTLPDDHDASDVPEAERRTEDEPAPTYSEQPTSKPTESEPAAGSTNAAGQVYVPGFGYVDYEGENVGIQDESIYENGNKIGIMGGN